MNARMIRILAAAAVICLAWAGAAWALCFESSADGKLLNGRMAGFVPRILDSYETGVPKGAVYAVQEPEGYYFKICDEPAQVDYFMKKWAETAAPGGQWMPVYATDNRNELASYIDDGVYLIKKQGANWSIWKYAAAEVAPSKIYVQTEPADARVRILNIRPKFVQGMTLAPGRYHIEVAADNHQTDRQWIEVQKGEDAVLTVKLKPGS